LASLSSRNALRGVMLAGMAAVAFGAVHFLRWPKMQPVVASLTAAGEKMPEFGNASDWDIWLSTRDLEIRSQAERGVEDSVSALILFGTTFTNLPPIASANAAANAAGSLTPAVNARIDAFIKALDERDDERFVTVLDFLRRRRVTEEELRAFLAGIVRRLALERTGEERLHEYTTSALLMVDFAIEEALRALKSKGETPAQTHRIAIISGGLDFAGTPGNYDFHQPQAITPFAVLEAALRLNLAQPGDAQVAVFELSPFALAHLRSAAAKARAGGRYVLQLPRRSSDGWNAAARAYWSHFGDLIGAATPAISVPVELHGVETRAVAVKPQLAARIGAEDMDVVTETADNTAGTGFDLVVALHALATFDRIEQTLAFASIAQMMNAGGLFLADAPVSAVIPAELQPIGVEHVAFTDRGEGHDIAAYRRK
jgi:hypothetical protein